MHCSGVRCAAVEINPSMICNACAASPCTRRSSTRLCHMMRCPTVEKGASGDSHELRSDSATLRFLLEEIHPGKQSNGKPNPELGADLLRQCHRLLEMEACL